MTKKQNYSFLLIYCDSDILEEREKQQRLNRDDETDTEDNHDDAEDRVGGRIG